jgi:hypothetical protein
MTPAKQLRTFLKKYNPKIVAFARCVLTKMRRRLPGPTELAYDNYSGRRRFRPNRSRFSCRVFVVLFPRWIIVYFLQRAQLPAPDHLQKGSGKRGRQPGLENLGTLDNPRVQALMNIALNRLRSRSIPRCYAA